MLPIAVIIVFISFQIVIIDGWSFKGQIKNNILLFNTISRNKEKFEAISEPKVTFYSCGPTVYDYAHIGNFRAFITYDLLKRWLEYSGYDVEHICNLTDIDDKIINKMMLEKKTLKEITNKYSDAFFEDLDVLNIKRAKVYPKATEYVKDIEKMIQSLINKGNAYEEKGSVYYRVNSFNNYGQLANLNFDDMIEGAGGFGPNERRGTSDKESNRDFALWKAFTPNDGEVCWDSAFGKGRPGWHIECSAMCHKLLGPTIDIHAGGIDLVFPHHSNEIAQSEAFSGKKFSNYWIHNGFVNINNEKMSKSLQNFKTLRDIAITPFDARAFRFMVVTAQYRSPLNFTPETLKAASNGLKRIDKAITNLRLIIDNNGKQNSVDSDESMIENIKISIKMFEEAMCDDMNTPRAVAVLFSLLNLAEKGINTNSLNKINSQYLLQAIQDIDTVFGVIYDVPKNYFNSNQSNTNLEKVPLDINSVPENIVELATERMKLKLSKQYSEADNIRKQLTTLGYDIKDSKDGYILYKNETFNSM